MELLVEKIESSRNNTKRRVSGANVDVTFTSLIHVLFKGEEE